MSESSANVSESVFLIVANPGFGKRKVPALKARVVRRNRLLEIEEKFADMTVF